MKKAVVVLPTYNESGNIQSLVSSIFIHAEAIKGWDIGVLVVDSTSPDGTADTVREIQKNNPNVYLLITGKHGLGKAYLDGFDYAIRKLQADVVFEMDADLSHDPNDMSRFLQEIEKGADMVVGTRYSKGGSIPANWGLDRKILSIGANLIVRLGFMNLKQSEWTNGYRAIRKWLVQKITPQMENYTGYVFQVAFLDKAMKSGARVAEIPVHFVDRTEGVSKISAPQYMVQTLLYVFTHSSFIKFGIVGVMGAIIDFGLAYLLKTNGLVILVANAISTETAIISNYLMNNFWSFSHKKVEGGLPAQLVNLLKFNLVSVGNIFIQLIGISIGIAVGGEKYWMVYKFFTIGFVVIPYSYILYNKIIWKKK
ncbi:glycosyltransferase [Candidatus Woesebacteria bacterium]|nr:glycosyltransferase [Candidatus Woesebacteria bacterium]